MESWTLKPLVKVLKKDSSIYMYIKTNSKELHVINYDKNYRIWTIEWKMNDDVFLKIEKKKINKYLESITNISYIEIKKCLKI